MNLILLNWQVRRLPAYLIIKCSKNIIVQQICILLFNKYQIPLGVRPYLESSPNLTDETNKFLNSDIFSHLIFFELYPPEYSPRSKLECWGYWS